MSLIQVARYSDVKYDFKDGYACVPVLEEAFDQARFAHCALQPGHSITPDVYSVTEHNQLFIFTKGKGYVTTRGTQCHKFDTTTTGCKGKRPQ